MSIGSFGMGSGSPCIATNPITPRVKAPFFGSKEQRAARTNKYPANKEVNQFSPVALPLHPRHGWQKQIYTRSRN